MNEQLELQRLEIERLKTVVSTLIGWMVLELGVDNAKHLIAGLNKPITK